MKVLLLLRMFLYNELLLEEEEEGEEEEEEEVVLPLPLLDVLNLDGSTLLSLFRPCPLLPLLLSVSSSES